LPKTPSSRQRPGYTQAIVTLTDAATGKRRDFWLDAYASAASREAYHRVVAEWEAADRRLLAARSGLAAVAGPGPTASIPTVAEFVGDYWAWARGYYSGSCASGVRVALRVPRECHGSTLRVTPVERARLVRLARLLGSAIKALVSIVSLRTFIRWFHEADKCRPKKQGSRQPGRPRTPQQIRRLVLKLAKETGWGYTRILSELKKLGVKVSRATEVTILKDAGMPTGPQRGEATWDQFIKSHAKTLWACDFLRHRIVTKWGLRDAYMPVFVNVATRRAIATTSTEHPDAAWVAAQVPMFKAAAGGGAT